MTKYCHELDPTLFLLLTNLKLFFHSTPEGCRFLFIGETESCHTFIGFKSVEIWPGNLVLERCIKFLLPNTRPGLCDEISVSNPTSNVRSER